MRAFRWLLVPMSVCVPCSGLLGGCSSAQEGVAESTDDLVGAPDIDLSMVSTRIAERRDPRSLLARRAAAKATNLSLAPSPALTYRGGPVIENVQVHAVFWGTGVPAENQRELEGFFKAVIGKGSPYFAMLSEYVTKEPPQTIGFGTFTGSTVDADAPTATLVTDAMVREELARLVDEEKLPPNDGHNIFMVYFPPGVKIDQGDGSLSCESFCAYHDSFTRNGNQVYYGIMPDLTSGGCEQGCGFNKKALDNLYSASTHELVEAVTDAVVDDNTDDLAWYDDMHGEIGDICDRFPDAKVRGYSVQTEWSNQDRGCRYQPSTANVTIDVTPASATVDAGGSAQFLVTAAGTLTSRATLKTMGLPKTVSAKFDPPTIKPGQYSTLTLTASADALARRASVTVYALDHNGAYHFVTPSLTVHGKTPTITSIDVGTGPSQGNTTVVVHGTGFGSGTKVSFGDVGGLVTDTAQDGTSITVATPSHVPGVVDVVVTNPDDETVTTANAFTFTAGAAPTITTVSPQVGPLAGGDWFRIYGTNFGPGDRNALPTVTIGGQLADSYPTPNFILAVIPPGVAGAADVVVTNGDGQSATVKNGYTYAVLVPPTLEPLKSATGPVAGGTYFTLTGNGFDTGARVTFDGKAATVTTNNPRFLGMLLPAHPAGAVDVVVTNGNGTTATLTGAFTYR